jgi:predicted CopG family antitoxin
VLDRLKAMRGAGESYSDVILRLGVKRSENIRAHLACGMYVGVDASEIKAIIQLLNRH